jgi:uncharacterized membrane protein
MVADLGLGDVLWGLVVVFFMVMYLMMLFSVIVDLVRDHGTSGVAKAGWVLFLLVLPLISVIVYLVVRGGGMAARATAEARQIDRDLQASSPVEQLATAKQLLDAGAIDAAEYTRLKQRLLA